MKNETKKSSWRTKAYYLISNDLEILAGPFDFTCSRSAEKYMNENGILKRHVVTGWPYWVLTKDQLAKVKKTLSK